MQTTKKEMVRFEMWLPPDLKDRAAKAAAEKYWSLASYMREALLEKLARDEAH